MILLMTFEAAAVFGLWPVSVMCLAANLTGHLLPVFRGQESGIRRSFNLGGSSIPSAVPPRRLKLMSTIIKADAGGAVLLPAELCRDGRGRARG